MTPGICFLNFKNFTFSHCNDESSSAFVSFFTAQLLQIHKIFMSNWHYCVLIVPLSTMENAVPVKICENWHILFGSLYGVVHAIYLYFGLPRFKKLLMNCEDMRLLNFIYIKQQCCQPYFCSCFVLHMYSSEYQSTPFSLFFHRYYIRISPFIGA